jgi:S1-C subfamily serine protease
MRFMLALALLTLISCTKTETRSYYSSTYSFTTNAVVQVRGDRSGTGFLLGTKRGPVIMTNHHICGKATAFEIENDGIRGYGKVITTSPKHDLCILTPSSNYSVALRLSDFELDVGDVVESWGFPRLGPLTKRRGLYLGEEWLEKNSESDIVGGRNAARLSFEVLGGQSGSPVLNEAGEVVGVVYAHEGDGTGIMIPLSAVKEFVSEFEGGAQ